jgi:predicted nucleic acid-binding protein
VNRVLILDSGPLGLVTQPQISPEVLSLNRTLLRCLREGDRVHVPAIIYYELRRELLRAQKTAGLSRLDTFIESEPGRYVPLSDRALRLAAELWAKSRQEGFTTAPQWDLDIDLILAAQAVTIGADVIVVTTNPRHIARFITARAWNEL